MRRTTRLPFFKIANNHIYYPGRGAHSPRDFLLCHCQYPNLRKPHIRCFHSIYTILNFPSISHLSTFTQREKIKSKLLVLFVLLALAAIVSAKAPAPQYVIKGKLFCDYCRVGYEVNPVQYIRGQLRLQCRSRQSDKEFTVDLKNQTNAHGEYMFVVNRDCGDEICEVTPVASSIRECSSPCAGRDRARVAITSNNGMVSNERYANSLAFTRTAPLSHCPQLLQQYLDLDSTD